jgi:diguanylate cyclase (GGDEF)-like protein
VGSFGAALYPLYLWVIVGNGMRFGPRCLIIAMAIGLGGFMTSALFNGYWSQNIPTAVGLGIGMIVLPLFYLVLIKRLHMLNERLDQQLSKASYAATHDALTDLANRAYFFQRIDEEIGAGERYKEKFAILFIDLDGFKAINDTYGHQYGDMTLKTVAKRLKKFVRKSDIVCRLGGDEFGVLLHGVHNSEDLRRFSQKLIKSLSAPIAINRYTVKVTASVGISLYPNHGSTPDELINKADQAMYRTKNKGKNGYTFYLEEVAIS